MYPDTEKEYIYWLQQTQNNQTAAILVLVETIKWAVDTLLLPAGERAE